MDVNKGKEMCNVFLLHAEKERKKEEKSLPEKDIEAKKEQNRFISQKRTRKNHRID